MISLILVSHSHKLATGLKELIIEMIGTSADVVVHVAAGADGNRLGTNPLLILDKIESSISCRNILIFTDIGSSLISAELAKDLVTEENLRQKVHLIDTPFVEGAFAAAVQASISPDLAAILKELSQV